MAIIMPPGTGSSKVAIKFEASHGARKYLRIDFVWHKSCILQSW